MRTINPIRESLIKFKNEMPRNTPVVMLNLLKFRDKALYPQGSFFEECSGRQAYKRYSDVAMDKLVKIGAKPIWMSKAMTSLIAPEDEEWDEVILVRYPSADAFFAMIQMPEYLAATVHREAALQDSRLIATIEILSDRD